jgi:hypothetical protein
MQAKPTIKKTAIFVKLDPKLFEKATHLKKRRGQSWVSYIGKLIEKDKEAA